MQSQISQITLEANFGWQGCNRILAGLCLMVSVTKPNFTYKDDKPEISNLARGQFWLVMVSLQQNFGRTLSYGQVSLTKPQPQG
jgi:hypothetical protein